MYSKNSIHLYIYIYMTMSDKEDYNAMSFIEPSKYFTAPNM